MTTYHVSSPTQNEYLILIINLLEMKYMTFNGQLVMISPNYEIDAKINNTRISQSLKRENYEYLKNLDVIPISNSITKTSVLFDLKTWEIKKYGGIFEIHYNTFNDTYYYILKECTPRKLLHIPVNFSSDELHFNVTMSNGKIILSAATRDKIEEYVMTIDTHSNGNTQPIEVLYEKISDAINHNHPDISYTYDKTNDDLVVAIDIKVKYHYEILKYVLKRVPHDRIDTIEKKIKYLYDKLHD